jgi:3D (Asp-Asp-Asp) domain-containing protein
MYLTIRKKRTIILPLVVCFGIGVGVGKVWSCGSSEQNIEPVNNTVVEEISVTEETTITPVPEYVTLKNVKLTAYCNENYPHICNNGDSTYTATGTRTTPGRTIAVDPSVIPYGSEVIINGHTYIAEDCGGSVKGNKIDICFPTHYEALQFGVQYADVQFVKPQCLK